MTRGKYWNRTSLAGFADRYLNHSDNFPSNIPILTNQDALFTNVEKKCLNIPSHV